VYRVGSRALKSGAMMALAAFAFVAIFFSHVPFPLIVLAAGVIGFVGARAGSAAFIVGEGHGGGNAHAVQDSALGDEMPEHVRPTVGRALRVSAIWLVLWLGPVIATWTTFVPCFLWIGLGAPFIERLRNHKPLSGALAGITAAVVGVILNLAIWFALHSWFRDTLPVGGYGIGFDMPVLASLNPW